MSLLDNLKVVAHPANQPKSAEHARRSKLIGKLQEQLALAEEQLGGAAYNRMRWVTVANAEGEPMRIQRPVRLKRWWSRGAGGNMLLTVRYGARALAISNGMTAIQVEKIEELPATITTVIRAVDAGELDGELAGAAAGKSRQPNKQSRLVTKK